MNRRDALRLLSVALLSGGPIRPAAVFAQGSSSPRPPTKWVPAEALSATAPGVTPREIRIGMSAAFKGTAAGLGTEFYRGAQAYYD